MLSQWLDSFEIKELAYFFYSGHALEGRSQIRTGKNSAPSPDVLDTIQRYIIMQVSSLQCLPSLVVKGGLCPACVKTQYWQKWYKEEILESHVFPYWRGPLSRYWGVRIGKTTPRHREKKKTMCNNQNYFRLLKSNVGNSRQWNNFIFWVKMYPCYNSILRKMSGRKKDYFNQTRFKIKLYYLFSNYWGICSN